MSIAVVTVAVGDEYQSRLPAWAEAVAALERQPDEVIIAVDDLPGALLNRVELILRDFCIVPSGRTWKEHPQVLANDAIAAAESEWICRMDVDDRIYPHAFNGLGEAHADVFMFGLSVNGEVDMYANTITAEDILRADDNLVFAGSPYRRTVWEASSGYQDMLYEDWRFWRETAGNGFTFQASPSIDYEYRVGGHNATRGADHSREKRRVFHDFH